LFSFCYSHAFFLFNSTEEYKGVMNAGNYQLDYHLIQYCIIRSIDVFCPSLLSFRKKKKEKKKKNKKINK